MPDITTVEVTSVGTGKVLDTWTFADGKITVGQGDLDDVLESLQARFADAATLWTALVDGGWSNGYIRVAASAADGPAPTT